MCGVDVIISKVVPLEFSRQRFLVDTWAYGWITTLNKSRTSATYKVSSLSNHVICCYSHELDLDLVSNSTVHLLSINLVKETLCFLSALACALCLAFCLHLNNNNAASLQRLRAFHKLSGFSMHLEIHPIFMSFIAKSSTKDCHFS